MQSERRGAELGRQLPPPRNPAGAPARGSLGGEIEGRWVTLGTGQAEPGSGERERQTPRCLPPRIFPADSTSFFPKPFPGGKALSETTFPTSACFAWYLTLLSQEPRSLSGPGKIPGKLGTHETPCCKKKANFVLSFIYTYRKEVVLLKMVQKQFGNIANNLEKPIILTQSKSRLEDKKRKRYGLWRKSLTVGLTHIHW